MKCPFQFGTIDTQCPLPSSPLGHTMSHGDANSNEGESKNPSQADASYRNFDHLPNRHRRSNSSQMPCLPTSEGPPVPISPASQKRLLELAPSEEHQLQTVVTAPLAEDETQLIPNMPIGFILPEVSFGGCDGFVLGIRCASIHERIKCSNQVIVIHNFTKNDKKKAKTCNR